MARLRIVPCLRTADAFVDTASFDRSPATSEEERAAKRGCHTAGGGYPIGYPPRSGTPAALLPAELGGNPARLGDVSRAINRR